VTVTEAATWLPHRFPFPPNPCIEQEEDTQMHENEKQDDATSEAGTPSPEATVVADAPVYRRLTTAIAAVTIPAELWQSPFCHRVGKPEVRPAAEGRRRTAAAAGTAAGGLSRSLSRWWRRRFRLRDGR
jgi:hypothetical protein